LALQIGIRGGLAVGLSFQTIDRFLLSLYLSLEFGDLVLLRLRESFQTTGVGIAGIIRTFPQCLRFVCMGR
jgi:hypothetical protein